MAYPSVNCMVLMAGLEPLARYFEGYRAVFSTALDPDECRRRLHDDLLDARGRWQHSRSDKRFIGQQWHGGIRLLGTEASVSPNSRMAYIVRLLPTDGGTAVICTHTQPYWSITRYLSILFLFVGIACGIFIVFSFRNVLLAFLFGTSIVAMSLAQFNEPFMVRAQREQQAIEQYLSRILEFGRDERGRTTSPPPGVKVVRGA